MNTNPRTLVVIAAAAKIDDQGYQWIEVMPTADKARNGPFYFTITRDDLNAYADSIAASPGLIPIDYDHEGSEGGSSIAAGWFTGDTQVVIAGTANPLGDTQDSDSLWARVKWTPQGSEEVKAGRFKRISPEFSFVDRDTKTGLMTRAKEIVAATLTNRPFWRELAPVGKDQSFLEESDVELLARVTDDAFRDVCTAALRSVDPQTREPMLAYLNTLGGPADSNEGDAEMTEQLKAIATELGLAEDATDEQIVAAIKAAKDTKPEVPADAVVLTNEQVENLTANAAAGLAAKTELDALKVSTKLDGAVRVGKITPAQRGSFEALASVDFDKFEKAVDELPEGAFKMTATGSGGGVGPDGEQIPAPEAVVISRTSYPVDEDTHAVAVKASKQLAEAGKKPKTQDELLEALEAAGYDDTVDRSRIETAAA